MHLNPPRTPMMQLKGLVLAEGQRSARHREPREEAQIWLEAGQDTTACSSHSSCLMLRGVQIGLHRSADGTIDTSKFKIVYVAPMKALVAEMVGNFSARLEP